MSPGLLVVVSGLALVVLPPTTRSAVVRSLDAGSDRFQEAAGVGGRGSAGPRLEEAHRLHAQNRYAEAAAQYRAAIEEDPTRTEAHFYLANCFDNLYRPARRGEATHDGYLQAALEHYKLAADGLTADTPAAVTLRKRSLQYLAALYGRDKLDRPAEAGPVFEQLIAMDPADVGSYFALVKIYEDTGDVGHAEEVLARVQAVAPDAADVWRQTAYFYNRRGQFDRAMDALARITQIEPENPVNHYQLAVFYEEKVRKELALEQPQKIDYLAKGMEAVDMALQLRPDYFEALTYKNLLLRQQARLETDPGRRAALEQEADAFQRKAIAVREAQRGAR